MIVIYIIGIILLAIFFLLKYMKHINLFPKKENDK